MIRIPYENMKFYYCYSHYDIHLSGICVYNGKLAKYVTYDETDYQTMTDTCPSCGLENKPVEHCHCEAYTDVVCEITELSPLDRLECWFNVHVGMKLWYIKRCGLQGLHYWKNWYNR